MVRQIQNTLELDPSQIRILMKHQHFVTGLIYQSVTGYSHTAVVKHACGERSVLMEFMLKWVTLGECVVQGEISQLLLVIHTTARC